MILTSLKYHSLQKLLACSYKLAHKSEEKEGGGGGGGGGGGAGECPPLFLKAPLLFGQNTGVDLGFKGRLMVHNHGKGDGAGGEVLLMIHNGQGKSATCVFLKTT